MLLTDKYADKIYGTITCYDRMFRTVFEVCFLRITDFSFFNSSSVNETIYFLGLAMNITAVSFYSIMKRWK